MEDGTEAETTHRLFKLAHQVLKLNINFHEKSIEGCAVLTIVPLKDSLNNICLNAKQIQIHRILAADDIPLDFKYVPRFQDDTTKYTLEQLFKKRLLMNQKTDADEYGELMITVPSMGNNMVQKGCHLHIRIEFSLKNPLGGVHFVTSAMDSESLDSEHMFSYKNSARMWFPCVDNLSECCTWEMEITVDEQYTAVSCGDLVNVVTVKMTEDQRHKTFYYKLATPVNASNIALAVGQFETFLDPNRNGVMYFCLPQLLPLMKNIVRYLHKSFSFFEELLGTFPYSCFKQVFVDETDFDVSAYASMAICSVNLLSPIVIIEQVYISRKTISSAVAKQYFGCFVTAHQTSDEWLVNGIADYLNGLFCRDICFGNNAYLDYIHEEMKFITDYERKYGGIVLDDSQPSNLEKNLGDTQHSSAKSLHTMSLKYADAVRRKAHLVIRLLEDTIGSAYLHKVLHNILIEAKMAAKSDDLFDRWHLLISSDVLINACMAINKSISPFIDQWVRKGGHPVFSVNSAFNRRENEISLEIRQDFIGEIGVCEYIGPIKVQFQLFDGASSHVVYIESRKENTVIACRTKFRRRKRRKFVLSTGEEVRLDLSELRDTNTLWTRVDPYMHLLRDLRIEQTDVQWRYQLLYERDIVAQLDAIKALEMFPSKEARGALTKTIDNGRFFFKVRCEAVHCLVQVLNKMPTELNGANEIIALFRKFFGSYSAPHMVKLNDFTNFRMYFIQKAIPVAASGLRDIHGACPSIVIQFLLDLIKYNYNARNRYSDVYYKAALVTALGETLTERHSGPSFAVDQIKLIIEDVTRMFNLDIKNPSYKYSVSIACLKVIRKLQKYGYATIDPGFFKLYASYGVYAELRFSAIECYMDYVKCSGSYEDIGFLLDLLENDPDRSVRYEVARLIIDYAPFAKSAWNLRDGLKLANRLWLNIRKDLCFDAKTLVNVFYALFGCQEPHLAKLSELRQDNAAETLKFLCAPSGTAEDAPTEFIVFKKEAKCSVNQSSEKLAVEFEKVNEKNFNNKGVVGVENTFRKLATDHEYLEIFDQELIVEVSDNGVNGGEAIKNNQIESQLPAEERNIKIEPFLKDANEQQQLKFVNQELVEENFIRDGVTKPPETGTLTEKENSDIGDQEIVIQMSDTQMQDFYKTFSEYQNIEIYDAASMVEVKNIKEEQTFAVPKSNQHYYKICDQELVVEVSDVSVEALVGTTVSEHEWFEICQQELVVEMTDVEIEHKMKNMNIVEVDNEQQSLGIIYENLKMNLNNTAVNEPNKTAIMRNEPNHIIESLNETVNMHNGTISECEKFEIFDEETVIATADIGPSVLDETETVIQSLMFENQSKETRNQ